MTATSNTSRTTVLVRTISGAEYILATSPDNFPSTRSFGSKLNSHQASSGVRTMQVDLIDGTTIFLNPSAVESFRSIPVPRHTSVDIRKGTITYGAYVDEDLNV